MAATLTLPKAFLGIENVEGARIARMRLGLPDASGRRAPEEIQGSEFRLEAGLVIKALGFDAEDLRAKLGAPELDMTSLGTLKIAPQSMSTNLDGVFAAGDIVRGASLVVWAIRDGRDAAAGIRAHLDAAVNRPLEAAE